MLWAIYNSDSIDNKNDESEFFAQHKNVDIFYFNEGKKMIFKNTNYYLII